MDAFRLKLTKLYSIWFLAALFVTLFIVYILLRMTIYGDITNELNTYLKQESQIFQKGDTPNESAHVYARTFGFFDVVLSNNNKIIYQDDESSHIRQTLNDKLVTYKDQKQVEIVTLHSKQAKVHLALLSKPLVKSGKKVGTLFVGKDLTREHEHLEKSLIVLAFIALLLFVLSMVMGDALAKKALVPIAKNMERQRQFVTNASHELKTPLAILQSSAEVIAIEETQLTEDSKSILQDMIEEINYMKHLSSELLELARYEHHQVLLEKKQVDLSTHIEQVIGRFHHLTQHLDVDIQYQPDKTKPIMISADPYKIEQVMYILLDNAVKYSLPHTVVLVTLQLHKPYQVKLSVKDHGIGISQDDKKHIFDPFYRTDKSRSKQNGGTGLGLSLAKAIVDAHKGTIVIEDAAEGGTIFHIFLPLK